MARHGLAALVAGTPDFRALLAELQGTGPRPALAPVLQGGEREARPARPGPGTGPPPGGVFASGLVPVQKSLYLAALFRAGQSSSASPAGGNGRPGSATNGAQGQKGLVSQRSLLVLTAGPAQAERLRDDLATLLSDEEVTLFPAHDTWPHEALPRGGATRGQRLRVLVALLQGRPLVVVAPVQACAERLLPPRAFREHSLSLAKGQRVDLHELEARLVPMGYERVDLVEGPGQFGVRGGIVDLFPPTADLPARVELWGDEVESIRLFNPETQRSVEELPGLEVPPAREFLLPNGGREEALARLRGAAARQAGVLRRLGRESQARSLEERVAHDAARLAEGHDFPAYEQYKPFFYPDACTLLSYLLEGVVVLDEPGRSRDQYQLAEREFSEAHTALLEKGQAVPETARVIAGWDDLFAELTRRPVLYLAGLTTKIPGMEGVRTLQVQGRPAELFHGKIELFAAEVRRWQRNHYKVCILVSTEQRADRITEILKDEGIAALRVERPGAELQAGNVVVGVGGLQSGCELPGARLVLLTDSEIFGHHKQRRRARKEAGTRLRGVVELRAGDYVVHVNHGIGRYQGIETLEIGGVHKDYLVVAYADDDKLYVPTDQVDLLQKYIGADGQPPRLYKLGGQDWARVKKKVKESVQEMAEGLLRLYAERETVTGYAFAPDTVWQQQFEDAFVYEETPDQLKAIEEVKRDMERPRPADRLLCGDVGYGKTEVAIRAAFKAVMDGKQVAVLVPTTILAQQHHRTFNDRFQGYPVRIEVLSRFQSPSEQAQVLAALKSGGVDVVIGTHRLLSRDVTFRDLGLVIVDEEQRFGVAQKERLKELRKSVDVLTLTATPIPRTLHMALVGVRDMSLIETPPEDRYPIRTYVVEYDDELVREAILRELARDGQVYFVYNRVQSIDRMAQHLSELVPEARLAVAHGQMEEERLERVMLDFLQGEYDVLLCSTIIETGMDIANVNTLVVYDADRMGLAQLYQLRGRVGRSNRVAYAYFTYRRDKVLSEDAEKRLQAIKEFTELGSGFKIALRDLEIRGAGNILGPEQHGFIASVGFELYCKLLEEAIKELRGEVAYEPPEPVIDLNVDAYLSDEYVADPQQKVELYKKVIAVRSLEEANELEEEMRDRFGELPRSAQNLLAVARIKVRARELGIQQISGERNEVVLRFLQGLTLPQETALALTRRFRGRLSVLPARTSQIRLRTRGLPEREVLALLEDVLATCRQAWPAGNPSSSRARPGA